MKLLIYLTLENVKLMLNWGRAKMDNFWPKGTDLYNKKTWHIFIKLNYNMCHAFFFSYRKLYFL